MQIKLKSTMIKILCASMIISSIGINEIKEVNASNKITYEPEEYDGLQE